MPELDRPGTDDAFPHGADEAGHATQRHNDLDDLALLESAVRAAGEIARKFYGGDFKRWSKEGGSPVSEADLAVDRYLQSTLLAARPDYGWLSEESPDNKARLTTKRVFVVDPIDGTVAFLKQRPHFTICAAVVEAGPPPQRRGLQSHQRRMFCGRGGRRRHPERRAYSCHGAGHHRGRAHAGAEKHV